MANTFPTDKNQYAISDNMIRQTDCTTNFSKDAATFTIKFAGDSGEVVNTASNFRSGTRVAVSTLTSKFQELSAMTTTGLETSGKVVSSTSTTKEGHAIATIVVSIPYSGKVSIGQGDEPDERKVVTWKETSTQYEFPLGIYAGEGDSASECNAGDFDAWKNEKNKNIDNYKNFKYTYKDAEGEEQEVELEGRTLDLAKKWYRGVEAVDRAYPEVVRVSTYYNMKGDEDEVDSTLIDKIDEDPNLYYIDDTPDSIWSSKFPDHSWLKSAFDVDIQPTEYNRYWNVTVTESWIGIPIDERGEWDGNLYGSTDRWTFAEATGQNNG